MMEEDWEESEEDTIPCPYCKRPIYEDSLRCPYCENYISEEDAPPTPNPWWIIVGIVLVLSIIAWWIAR